MSDARPRALPVADEAEISVLGAMLIDEDAIGKVAALLEPPHYGRERSRIVHRAVMAMWSAGQVVDAVSIGEELERRGELAQCGGLMFIADMLDAVPTAANVEGHARIVRDAYVRRSLIHAGNSIADEAIEPGEIPTPELVDRAQAKLFAIAEGAQHGTDMETLRALMTPTFDDLQRRVDAGGGLVGLATGLHDLDEMTGGLQGGDLIIVAARPSMGKTALVTGLATHIGIDAQRPVAVFSLEMSKRQMVQRMLASEAMVNLAGLLRGRMADEDFVRLAQAAGHLQTAPIWIDDTGAMTPLQVRAKARRLRAERDDLALIVVDYVQLMSAPGENRTQEVSLCSRSLKSLAKELDVPVVLLSQLSRKPEERSDKRPMLSDLRESGSLEQDADGVWMLYRPEYYTTPAQSREKGLAGRAELIIQKQRNGPTGTVELYFRAECARFESISRRDG